MAGLERDYTIAGASLGVARFGRRLVNLFTIRAETAGLSRNQVPGFAMPLMRSILALALVALALTPAAALADPSSEPISVKVNMARILKINAPAATVIIGNPGVADVTIQDPQTLILTGKSYGETNLIVLDSAGSAIADTLVSVVQPQSSDDVTVFLGLARTTLNCQPICQPTVSLGDDAGFSGQTLGSSTTLQSMAH